MNLRYFIPILCLLVVVLFSGCVKESPTEKGNVVFSLGKVTITSELEVREPFTNETKTVTTESKIVIIPITIENKLDKWIKVSWIFNDLIDDEENKYTENIFIKTKERTYSVKQILSVNKEEIDHLIPPNSTELEKFIFTIPKEREPKKLRLRYGIYPYKEAKAEDWFKVEMEISP